MRDPEHDMRAGSEGKGSLGCMFSIVALIVGAFVGIKTLPLYYSVNTFETDVKSEVTRAGARFYDDTTVVNDILELAKKDEVGVKPENVKVRREGNQLFVTIDWTAPVDLIFFEYTFQLSVNTSGYVGKV